MSREGEEFGGANEGPIEGVEEEDDPFAEVIVEAYLGGEGGELITKNNNNYKI